MVNLALPLIFIVGISFVVLFSLAGKIHLSLLFLIPLFPLQNVIERLHQFPLGKDFIDIILIAMMLGWVFRSIINKEKIFEPTPLNKLLFIMAIFTYFSLWRSSTYLGFPPPVSASDVRVQNWKNYMIFPLLYFITVNNIKSLKQIKWLIIAMLVSMLIMDSYTLKQIRWMPGLASREKLDGTFVWAGVNVVAAFYAQYIFVLLGILIMHKKKVYKIIFGILFLVGVYITLFLYSRGAYAALITGFLAISLIKKRIFIIPLILLFMFWQSLLPATVVERINKTKTEQGVLDTSTQHRLELWKESIRLFKADPILGTGFNAVPFLGLAGGFTDTHNIYLRILAEQGLIGITIFLIFFLLALKSSWRLYKTASDALLKGLGLGFIACIIATLTTNMFGDRWTYLQLGAYFWVFLGLVVRGNLIARRQFQNKFPSKKKSISI